MTEQEYPKAQERMTKEHTQLVARQLGLGAVVLDLHLVDYTRGSMHTGPRERVFWTTDGHRVTVVLATDGGVVAAKSREPDPELPEVVFPGYDGS